MSHPLIRQIYASIGTICLYFSNGFIFGLIPVILPNLRETSLKLTEDEESWIPSILLLTIFPSQCISGLLTTFFGRKYIFLVSLIPGIVTCTILYWAQDYAALFAAYMIGGLVGGGIAIGPMLVAESCSPKYRGVLLNSRLVSMFSGIGTAHLTGHFCDWRSVVLYGTIPGIVGIVTTITSPESPAWLAYKERFNECKSAFLWYRGESDCEELNQLLTYRKTDHIFVNTGNSITETRLKDKCKRFCDKAFLKAVSINVSVIVCIEASGKQIFETFLFDIISEIMKNKKNTYLYALGIDFADIISVIFAFLTVKFFKRRTLLFGSGLPALVILLITCMVSYLFSLKLLPASYSWLTILLFSIYFLTLSIGMVPILFTLMVEVYPLSHRGAGVVISSLIYVSVMFVITKITPYMMTAYGIHGVYFINAIATSLAMLHLYFTVPETNNKTLQYIERELKNEVINDENQDSDNNENLLDYSRNPSSGKREV